MIKIKKYAVINLNNMFSVLDGEYIYIDINDANNPNYKNLLQAEYREIKSNQKRILKNAELLYKYKLEKKDSTPLAKRCNDFLLLEKVSDAYPYLYNCNFLSSDKTASRL